LGIVPVPVGEEKQREKDDSFKANKILEKLCTVGKIGGGLQ